MHCACGCLSARDVAGVAVGTPKESLNKSKITKFGFKKKLFAVLSSVELGSRWL
jgi:hypothetical protein